MVLDISLQEALLLLLFLKMWYTIKKAGLINGNGCAATVISFHVRPTTEKTSPTSLVNWSYASGYSQPRMVRIPQSSIAQIRS